ncbi:MAG: hypothetical protein CL928_15245 [Deltaproteobacteria bacterium]|nr:hypothetical protein [Deltaproteobacteria bacterium]
MVAFSAVVLFLFLLALEGALQVLASGAGPHGEVPEDGALEAPDPAAFRVVAVGDSWVYGAESLPEEAFIEVFADRVEKRTQGAVQVYNLGVSASNSAQALLALHDVIDRVKPNLVVALTGANNMLHDIGVDEAGRLMGDDARMVPGLTLLSRSRLVRLGRLIWVTVFRTAGEGAGATGTGATVSQGDPFGTPGLPDAPEPRATGIVRLPWWDLYLQRRWDDGLRLLEDTPDPSADPRYKGIRLAWSALFMAHMERFDEAETLAARALELGGDDATAWESRAVAAMRRDQPLFALQHRVRVADAEGHPWFRERARGLVLMELEAWQAAQNWLSSGHLALPGNLELLMGLAKLPGVTRTKETEEALYKGPRGLLTRSEYFAWHLASSGKVDRAVASLGDVETVEPAALEVTRGRGYELQGDPEAAAALYARVLERADSRSLDKDRARAGLIRISKTPERFVQLLGVVPESLAPTPSTASALVGWFRSQGRCEDATRVGQASLELGYDPIQFEKDAGDCLARGVGWSLVEQVISRGIVIDRRALVLGHRGGTVPAGLGVDGSAPLSPPEVSIWQRFQERRFEEILPLARLDWRALILAHMERSEDALRAADLAEQEGGDPSIIAWTRAMAYQQKGHFIRSLRFTGEAAEAPGEPWIRKLARGRGLALARHWRASQAALAAVLRVAPGYLEALEVLTLVPRPERTAATDGFLRHAPSGHVASHRWAAWYLDQDRPIETAFALSWPSALADQSPGAPFHREMARAQLLEAEGDHGGGALAFGRAAVLTDDGDLVCRALSLSVDTGGRAAGPAALADLEARCTTHGAAMSIVGRHRAIEGRCEETRKGAWKAVEAGGDPLALLDWIEPCVSIAELEIWMKERAVAAEVPEEAIRWLLSRFIPGMQEKGASERVDEKASVPLMVRHLDAMARLARSQGAQFVALTYPFPGAHHVHVRDLLLDGVADQRVPVLDLYSHFERTFSEAEWQGMRTPQDHVDARGYREMGELLFQYAAERRMLTVSGRGG